MRYCFLAVLFVLGLNPDKSDSKQGDITDDSALLFGIDPIILKNYEPIEFNYTGGEYQEEPFDCGIIKPEHIEADRKIPLVVWLCGIGPEELHDQIPIGHLRWLHRTVYSDKQSSSKDDFCLLVMKVKAEKGRWFTEYRDPPKDITTVEEVEMLTILRRLITQAIHDYPIDQGRISLIGISSGADASFEMGMRYPSLFSAMAVFGSLDGGDLGRIDNIRDIPVWAFQSLGDQPEAVRATVNALNQIGGTASLTEIPGNEHFCWLPAFEQWYIMDWLLAQRRGEASYPPGVTPWPWWNLPILFAIIIVVYLAVKSELIRKRAHATAQEEVGQQHNES